MVGSPALFNRAIRGTAHLCCSGRPGCWSLAPNLRVFRIKLLLEAAANALPQAVAQASAGVGQGGRGACCSGDPAKAVCATRPTGGSAQARDRRSTRYIHSIYIHSIFIHSMVWRPTRPALQRPLGSPLSPLTEYWAGLELMSYCPAAAPQSVFFVLSYRAGFVIPTSVYIVSGAASAASLLKAAASLHGYAAAGVPLREALLQVRAAQPVSR
jgi:hypothetical protein